MLFTWRFICKYTVHYGGVEKCQKMQPMRICLLSGRQFEETFEKVKCGEKSNKCNLCDFASSRSCHLRTHLKNTLEKIQTNVPSVTRHPSRQKNWPYIWIDTEEESQINATIANMPSLRQAFRWDIWKRTASGEKQKMQPMQIWRI